MDKIICIMEKGFRKITLPNKHIIDITSCDDGCLITSDNMDLDIIELDRYIGYPIYDVVIDNNYITKGFKLGKCKITNHYEYGYKCILWNTESITGDNMIKYVE